MEESKESDLRTAYRLQAASLLLLSPSSSFQTGPSHVAAKLSTYFSRSLLDDPSPNGSLQIQNKKQSQKKKTVVDSSEVVSEFLMSIQNITKNVQESASSLSPDDTTHPDTTTDVSLIIPPVLALSEHICKSCGLLLASGIQGTTTRIRSLKRGSTRRRRCSRYRMKEFTKRKGVQRQLQHQSSINTNSSLEYTHKEFANRVTDGESNHCVVYKCGLCGNNEKKKGIPISTKVRRSVPHTNENIDSRVKHTKQQRKPKKQTNASSTTKISSLSVKEINKTTSSAFGDFISLGGGSSKQKNSKASKKNTSHSNHKKGDQGEKKGFSFISSLNDTNSSKHKITNSDNRKRKNTATSKSNQDGKNKNSKLMNFLSSLNDF